MRFANQFLAASIVFVIASGSAAAQERTRESARRQSQSDAWWTGPMLANSAATLPRGHFLLEPYVFGVMAKARFDVKGQRQITNPSNSLGSLTYILYGLTDRVALGLIPTAAINTVGSSISPSQAGWGDTGLLAQFRVTSVRPQSSRPTISLAVQETFPTGKHDRLDGTSGAGFGTGAYTTTLSLFSQTYLWLPNGRILRMRVNLSHAMSSRVTVEGVSVYGTETDFRGHAAPGANFVADTALEYSLSRRWVLASDVTYNRSGATRVTGFVLPNASHALSAMTRENGSSAAFGLAPAIEYSWKPTVGILLGARIIAAGRNTPASVTPALAVNIVH